MGSDLQPTSHVVRVKGALMAIRRFFVVAEVDLAPALWLNGHSNELGVSGVEVTQPFLTSPVQPDLFIVAPRP